MTSNVPDFYLASSEGYGLTPPRACYCIARLRGNRSDDYLVARIEPPLIGQKYRLGATDIEIVVLAARHKGESLFPVSQFPISVYVARVLVEDPQFLQELQDHEIALIAWGELYETESSARQLT